MKHLRLFSILFLLMVVSSLAGCISGGSEDNGTTTQAPTTTAAPTTAAPTSQAPATTAAPTTVPPTTTAPSLVHNPCSTGYINIDPGNTRHYPCDSPDNPTEVWNAEILMTEGPVLVDYNRAYLFQSNYGNYEIKCYDVHTGEEHWTINTPFMDPEDVLLQDEKIYLFQLGEEPRLYCYDARDGALLWTSINIMDLYPAEHDIDLLSMNYSDGKVLALLITIEDEVVVREDSIFCCFNGSTGQVIWNNRYDDHFHGYPAIDNGIAYFTAHLDGITYNYSNNTAEALMGIDIDTGNLVLNQMLQEYEYNGREILASNGRIYALATRRDIVGGIEQYNMYLICFSTSGDIVWEHKMAEKVWGDLTFGNDKIFLSRDDQVICIDTNTHDELWDRPITYNIYNRPIITNDKLIVFRSQIGTTPQVVAIDQSNGNELWAIELDGIQISKSASFYDNMMLVATDLGHLYCFG